MKKSSMTTNKPKVAMQGGMGKAPVQPAKIQPKIGAAKPGASSIVYSKQPSGTRGSGTTAGKPRS